MPFASRCASEALHDEWNCPPSGKLSVKVKSVIKQKLLTLAGKDESIHYTKAAPKFCAACIQNVTKLYPELQDHTFSSTEASGVQLENPQDVQEIAEPKPSKMRKIDVSELTHEERVKLAYDLGKVEADSLRSHALTSSRKRDLDSLLKTDVAECHNSSDCQVIHALLSGISHDSQSSNVDELLQANFPSSSPYQLCKTVESILNLSAFNLTLPAHMRESVLLYTLTGSKLALKILGSGGAHASYQSVKSWLANLVNVPSEIPKGDLIAAFDNNQVLQRRWKVKLKNEVKCNIITVVVVFQVRKDGSLQHQAMLKPSEWSKCALSESDVRKIKYIDQADDVKEEHYCHLHEFLSTEIQTVAKEQCNVQDNFQDCIDRKVAKEKNDALFKVCYNCHFEKIPKAKHTCPVCKVNVTKAKLLSMGIDENGHPQIQKTSTQQPKEVRVSVEPSTCERQVYSLSYSAVGQPMEDEEHKFMGEIPTVHIQEPVYVNPCSYDAVARVMRNIGHKVGVKKYGGEREWVIVVCDGVPYNLCKRLITSMHVCSKCNLSLDGKEACAKHNNESHLNDNANFSLEFDWVLIQPGSGHVEMNMVKGIVELGWDVFWKNLAICLNFRSETALKYAKRVSDHHKGWTMCRIARLAIARELIVPFVRKELRKEHPDMSVAAFMKYVMLAQDPNYAFMCDFTFELLDAVFMYRVGVRYSMPRLTHAGRAKFAKLWSGRHHPLYRELEMSDLLLLTRMPPEVRELVQTTASVNLTGKPGTGEGADFRLEEVNKQVQQWLPNVPSTKDWQNACCNFDKLVEFRKKVFNQMNISDPKLAGSRHVQNIDEEVDAFRTKLRAAEYLLHPESSRVHTSLDGTPLDPDLKDLCQKSRENRSLYVDRVLSHETTADILKAGPPTFKAPPVFVTTEERERHTSIENLTLPEIKTRIEELISSISDSDVREVLETTWAEFNHSSRRPTKPSVLDFYHELTGYADEVDPFPTSEGDSDED